MSKSSNPFSTLYRRYGWQYKCDGVGDTFAEQLAFKVVGESTLLVLLAPAAYAFWEAAAAIVDAQRRGMVASQETLRQLSKSKEIVCGKLMEQTDSWVDLLKGYITPARVTNEYANIQCEILESAEVKMKSELNRQMGDQIKSVLSYIVDWMGEAIKGNIIGSAGVAVLYKKLSQYRHDLVCLFAAMWQKLWVTLTTNVVICKEISDGYIIGGEPGYKMKL